MARAKSTKSPKPRSALDAVLREHGLTVLALANALDLGYASVWHVAAGKSAMTRARAERYADALGRLGVKVEWHQIC